MTADPVAGWLAAIDERHLADLTPSEVSRALRALSSCYVERRARLAAGGALESAGKRAAFALFYAPLHFAVVREVVRALPGALDRLRQITDIGCGTGAAGVAWALEAKAGVAGIDRHPWAVAEANWTYRTLGVRGRAVQRDVARAPVPSATAGSAVLAAYTANELTDAGRVVLLSYIRDASQRGARVLVVEPISRRTSPWWKEWEADVLSWGGRADEWRFPASLGVRQQSLARAAGLDPRELTARTFYLPGK